MKTNTSTIDNEAANAFQIAFQMGLTMPIQVLVPVWGRDESTLCRMARQGRIPGAYKQGGSWWIYPKLLTEPSDDFIPQTPKTVFSKNSKPIQPRRNRR